MIIELVNKEFKLAKAKSGNKFTLIAILLKAIAACLLIALISYLTYSLDTKISAYSSDSSFDFLVFSIFIMFILGIIEGLVRARKVMFDKKDSIILAPLCISTDSKIIAKMIYVYLYQVIESFIMSFPILVTYGALRQFIPYYYVFCVLYPFIISLFSIGVIFTLVVLVQVIYKFLQNKEWLQFICASVIVVGLCYLYQVCLNLFLKVLDNYSFKDIFSSIFIKAIDGMCPFLLPVYSILSPVIKFKNILSCVLISLGLLLLFLVIGYFLSITFYTIINQRDDHNKNKTGGKYKSIGDMKKGLIKKELMLIFRNSGNTFSYTALLIMLPFLSFAVLSSINTILQKNLRVLLMFVPDMMTLIQMLLLLEFVLVIHSSGSSSFSMEGQNLMNVKLLPINDKLITLTKVLIPLSLTSISYFVTVLACYLTDNITLSSFFFFLFIGLLLLVIMNFGGVVMDMHDLGAVKKKFSTLFSYSVIVYPMLLVLVDIGLDFTIMKGVGILYFDLGLTFILSILVVVFFLKKSSTYFKKMEVRNI